MCSFYFLILHHYMDMTGKQAGDWKRVRQKSQDGVFFNRNGAFAGTGSQGSTHFCMEWDFCVRRCPEAMSFLVGMEPLQSSGLRTGLFLAAVGLLPA